jgi:AraC-like DNA-binding protein
MASFPRYLQEFPNRDTSFPLYINAQRPTKVSLHRHDFLELTWVIEGSGVEIINGTSHSMKRGTLVFLMPYQLHEIISEVSDPLRMYVINFDMALLMDNHESDWGGAGFLQSQIDSGLPYIQLEAADQAYMHVLFESIYQEYKLTEPWRNWLIKARLIEILSLSDRLRRVHLNKGMGPDKAANRTPASANCSIWTIIHYVQTHYREQLSLADLARHFHFHPSHLSESIKQHLGQTFTAFIHELRIRHASSLLVSTDISVTAVALEVGFASYSTFCRLFRREKGISPVGYRKAKKTLEN